MLTAERLRKLFDCDPTIGVFTRRISRGSQRAGTIAGNQDAGGYWVIGIEGRSYFRHRLVWLWVHGEWPPGMLDHRDNCPGHDWIDNLRAATDSQNKANSRRPRNNASGFKGVTWSQKERRWEARICQGGTQLRLGYFNSAEEAHAAYVSAAQRLFGQFANAGTAAPTTSAAMPSAGQGGA